MSESGKSCKKALLALGAITVPRTCSRCGVGPCAEGRDSDPTKWVAPELQAGFEPWIGSGLPGVPPANAPAPPDPHVAALHAIAAAIDGLAAAVRAHGDASRDDLK